MAGPKLHHYLPQWYLRLFANAQGRLRVYRRGTGLGPFVSSVKKIAAEKNFYRPVVGDGQDPLAIERFLAIVDQAGKNAIDRIAKGPFPPGINARRTAAEFLGFQLFRTPESRRMAELNTEALLKVTSRTASRDSVRETLKEAGLDTDDEAVDDMMNSLVNIESYELRPDQNAHLQLMLDLSIETGRRLLDRSWLLGISKEPILVTSDHPLTNLTLTSKMAGLIGLGLDLADMLMFPIDPQRLLLFAAPDLGFDEGTYSLADRMAEMQTLSKPN